jgi:hypothetical protein
MDKIAREFTFKSFADWLDQHGIHQVREAIEVAHDLLPDVESSNELAEGIREAMHKEPKASRAHGKRDKGEKKPAPQGTGDVEDSAPPAPPAGDPPSA